MKQIVICPKCDREITTAKETFQCRICYKFYKTKEELRNTSHIIDETDKITYERIRPTAQSGHVKPYGTAKLVY